MFPVEENIRQKQKIPVTHSGSIRYRKYRLICIEKAMQIVLQAHGGKLSDSWMNNLQKGLNDCMSTIKDAVRVVCLSEVYDSMLMWSHYAQNHRFGLMFILARR